MLINTIMSKLINYFLKHIKGHQYSIDKNIPMSYLMNVIFSRVFMLLRGFLTPCKHGNFFFRDKGTVMKAKSKIFLGDGVSIGRNCFIDANSKEGIRLGNQVSIGKNTTIECSGSLLNLGIGLNVGDGSGLGTHGFFGCAGGIVIGQNSIFGNFVSLHSENHNFKDISIPIKLQGVNRCGIKIGNNCWIGAKATILDGVTIEDGCIIGAGSVVTKGIYTMNGIYAGVPAKLIKMRN
jgi:acetyltransferase-like isoleucine patch superfamily enzyme